MADPTGDDRPGRTSPTGPTRPTTPTGPARPPGLSGQTRQSRPNGPPRPPRATEFTQAYEGRPAWDIGRPQPAFLALAESGAIRGRVLDVGCGTGEHVLMAAGLGLPATGVDIVPNAIAAAETKARERGLAARFLVWNALELAQLSEQFDTVLDCGLFHVLDDEERGPFADSVRSVLVPGGRYFMLCFSEHQPGDWGPRRVRQEEIRACFQNGWRVDSIEPVTLDVAFDPAEVSAWRASMTRT